MCTFLGSAFAAASGTVLRAAVLGLSGAAFGGAFLAWAFATACVLVARCIALTWAAALRTFRTAVCAFRFRFVTGEDVARAIFAKDAIELRFAGAFGARVHVVAFTRRFVAIMIAVSSVGPRIAIFTVRAFTPFRIAVRARFRTRTRFLRTCFVGAGVVLTSFARGVAVIAV